MTDVNEHLRAHVTRVGFDLSLARSHIAALVYIEELRRNKWDAARICERPRGGHPLARPFALFVSGARGLQDRGLLIHRMPTKSPPVDFSRDPDGTPHILHDPRTWRITPAGRHVLALLVEAGIYAEYASALAPMRDTA
jgi:hypothetical protein